MIPGRVSPPGLFFFKIVMTTLCTSYFHMNFRITYQFLQKPYRQFDWDCIEFINTFGKNWHIYNTGIPHFIVLCFIAVHRYNLCFSQIEVLWQLCMELVYWRHFSKSICSLCISVFRFGNSHSISYFLNYYYICFVDMWSVVFDVTLAVILGHHERRRPYKTSNLIDKCSMSSDCSTDWLVPCFSPSPQTSLFPETQKYWNRPVNNPTMASKSSSEGKSRTSHFKSKARND